MTIDARKLPLDRYRFVIQKKVTPFHKALMGAREDPEEMKQMMSSFVDLIYRRLEKNIQNSDPNLKPNFGFLGGKAVEIDFGNYVAVEPNETLKRKELENFLVRFSHWVEKYAPEYMDDWKTLHKSSKSRYSPDQ